MDSQKGIFVVNALIGNGLSSIVRGCASSLKGRLSEFTSVTWNTTTARLPFTGPTSLPLGAAAIAFKANAEAAGYSVLSDQISASSAGIGNAAESRRFVKWALEAKKGQVSPMLQDDKQSYLMAVAVADVYGDYMPWYSTWNTTTARLPFTGPTSLPLGAAAIAPCTALSPKWILRKVFLLLML